MKNSINIEINGKLYTVRPSTRKNKKYDVYILNYEDSKHPNINYLLSFGDKRYQHFYDKFSYYSDLNHYDENRREKYFKRHGYTNDVSSAKFWSNNFLW